MSVVIIPTPGMVGGPCRGSCDHAKCHTMRSMADERCHHCGVRFGFGARITGEPPMHMRCAQGIAAKNGTPASHPIHDPATGPNVTGHHGDKR